MSDTKPNAKFKCIVCGATKRRGSLIIVEKGPFKKCEVRACKSDHCRLQAANGKWGDFRT